MGRASDRVRSDFNEKISEQSELFDDLKKYKEEHCTQCADKLLCLTQPRRVCDPFIELHEGEIKGCHTCGDIYYEDEMRYVPIVDTSEDYVSRRFAKVCPCCHDE